MNWQLVIALTVVILIIAFVRLRVEPRRARLVNWLFIYPGVLILVYYAWFRAYWLEVLIALGVGGLLMVVWWIAYGSYLPTPNSDNISVWGQEVKKPAQVAAEAEAELEKIKREKEALERELAKLKSDSDSPDQEGSS